MSEQQQITQKTLVLLLNVKGAMTNWQITAHMRHVQEAWERSFPEWKCLLMPVMDQPTALYWLEGDKDTAKTFEGIKDRIVPVLHAALEECLAIKPGKLHIPPGKVQQAMEDGFRKLNDKAL